MAEEKKIPEKFLPIGTTVMLKKGTTPVMITSYCVFPKSKKTEIYDYGSCAYPQGILEPDTIHAFNHEDIDKILHMGYETNDSKEVSRILNGGIENYKKKVIEESKKENQE